MRTGERIGRGAKTWSTIEASSERSDYSSNDTVDSQGHAHGGKFSANSASESAMRYATTTDIYADGEGQDEYVFDDRSIGTTSEQTSISVKTTESGSYEDLVFPFELAIGVQSGSYDTTKNFARAKRWDTETSGGSANTPDAPTVVGTSESHTTETDDRVETTHGEYSPYSSSQSTELSQDYEKHVRSDSDTDYDGSPYHYFGRYTYDLELHIQPDSAKGHGHEQGHGLITYYTPYSWEETWDPFEGQTPPAAPKNPPPKTATPPHCAGEGGWSLHRQRRTSGPTAS